MHLCHSLCKDTQLPLQKHFCATFIVSICHLTIIKEIFVFISRCSEKANLAVTLSTTKNEVLAHASFSDHPTEELVDQACWENLLQSHVNGEKFTVSKANQPRCPLIFNIYFLQPSDSLVFLFSSP